MLRSTDFGLRQIQATAFVAGSEIRPSSRLGQLLQELGSIYDGDLFSLPSNLEVPPGVPTVQLFSNDGALRLDIARSRVNLCWTHTGGQAADLSELFETFSARLSLVLDRYEVAAGRLGAIVTRQASVSSPGQILARQFCRDEWLRGPLNRPEGFELHAHKTFRLREGLMVNSWMRIRAAKQGQVYGYVVADQDINTLVEERETRRFSALEAQAMFLGAASEFDSILRLYFPSSDTEPVE